MEAPPKSNGERDILRVQVVDGITRTLTCPVVRL